MIVSKRSSYWLMAMSMTGHAGSQVSQSLSFLGGAWRACADGHARQQRVDDQAGAGRRTLTTMPGAPTTEPPVQTGGPMLGRSYSFQTAGLHRRLRPWPLSIL